MTKGKCSFCKKIIGKTAMKKHFNTCKEWQSILNKNSGKNKVTFFHIAVQGKYLPEYWMNMGVNSNTTLQVLDNFLRDIWVECCGHMSMFEINIEQFSSHPSAEMGDRSFNVKLSNIIEIGDKFDYMYDMGTPTELTLKVLGEYSDVPKRNKPIILMARNEQPDIKCSCGKPATNICSICNYDDPENAWLCDECAKKHECGEEMLLPVLNSPRTGECGYCG